VKFRIRREYDLAVIAGLDKKVFSPTDEILDLNGMWWVATNNKAPVAYAGMKLFTTEGGVISYFHRVGVLKEFRRNGLHKRLILKRVAGSKEQDVTAILTYTMYYNVVSNNNLIYTGFSQYCPEYAWVGTDDVIYWKKQLR
jgi:hypothetical protein